MNTATLVTFSVYLIGVIILGLIAYRQTSSLSDYILGGRRLSAGVAALSAGASDMSGWLLLGLPGAMYTSGISQAWIAIGLVIGAYLNWKIVAAPLRRYTEQAGNALTIPDFFEKRFEDKSRLLRLLSAVVILLFFTFYTASGLVGGAILFEKSFGLEYQQALIIGTVVIVAYTFLGGFLAVSWTDVIQGLLMALALVVVPIVAIQNIGGWDSMIEKAQAMNPEYLNLFRDTSILGIISLMAWGLGYFGQPHILARFMALSSESEVPKARMIGMSWMIFSLVGAMLTGFVGIVYFAGAPLENAEKVFLELSQVLFNPWVAGFLLAAILSAIMSTIDSQLLVSSSTIASDFYQAILRKNACQKELIWVGRFAVVGIALIAFIIAQDPESTILGMVSYAWAGFGGAFGPIIILSIFSERITRNGALAGMLVGAITVVVWSQLTKSGVIPFSLYEIVPAFILNWVVTVMVSKTGTPPNFKLR